MTEPRSWAGTQRVSLWKESLEGLGRPGVDPHGLAHDWGQSARTRAHTHTHHIENIRSIILVNSVTKQTTKKIVLALATFC